MEEGIDGSMESNGVQRRNGLPVQMKGVLLPGIDEERDMGTEGMARIPNN